ncbi:MAG TPA: extracellular solute-binding protein [Firmicutes bacterium]|nr:extracellular solute-binding protein [Bacillota bacterium]
MIKRVLTLLIITALLMVPTAVWAADKTVVEFWFGEFEETYIAAMNDIIADFHKAYPHIQINMTKSGSPGTMTDPLLISIAGGVPPDLFYSDGHTIQQWYLSENMFVPLSDIVPPSALEGYNWIPSAERSFFNKGKWIGFPFRTAAYGLYQNQDILAKAGFPITSGPVTIQELDQWGEKLYVVGADGKVTVTGFYPWGNNFAGSDLGWLWVFGGDFYDWEKNTTRFAGVPEHLRTLQWMSSYALKYGFSPPTGNNNFMAGKVAMFVQSTTWLTGFQTSAPDLNFYVSAIPRTEARDHITYAPNLGIAIPQGAKDYEAAAQFILYLGKPEVQAKWYRQVRSIPTNMDAIRMIARDITDPRERNMINTMGNSFGPPPLLRRIQEEYRNCVTAMMKGEMSPVEVLETVDAILKPEYAEIFN